VGVRAFGIGLLAFAACTAAPSPVSTVTVGTAPTTPAPKAPAPTAPAPTAPAPTSEPEWIGGVGAAPIHKVEHTSVTQFPAAGAAVRCVEEGEEYEMHSGQMHRVEKVYSEKRTRVFVVTPAGTAQLPTDLNDGNAPGCSGTFGLEVVAAGHGAPAYTLLKHADSVFGVFIPGPKGPILLDAYCELGLGMKVTPTSCGPTLVCSPQGSTPQLLVVFSASGGIAPAKGCRTP
jgi:hypothetical protein